MLRVLLAPIIDQEFCRKVYAHHRTVSANMLCAGYITGGKDTCQVRFGH